jgi:hypothetical protein
MNKKHYRLRTYHLRSLIQYVENDSVIDTHDDVPKTIQEQLRAEEQQQIDQQQKNPNHLINTSRPPPININVLPTPSSQPLLSCSYSDL